MAVRTDLLIHDSRAYAAGVVQDIAVVPAGEVWLIRFIAIRNATAVAGNVRLALLRSGISIPFADPAIAAAATQQLTGQYVVGEAGDTFRATTTTIVGTVTVFASGSRLVT